MRGSSEMRCPGWRAAARRARSYCAFSCALQAAWACGVRPPAPPPPPAPLRADANAEAMRVDRSFWIPGEQMRWELSARGIVGLEVVLGVGQPGVFEGRDTVIVRSRTRGVGLVNAVVDIQAESETWIDLDTALPLLRTTSERVGKREKHATTRFLPGKIERTVKRGEGREHSYERTLPEDVALHDIHSMLGILRAWTPREGSYAYLDVIEDGLQRRQLVRFTRREVVKTALGRNPAIRLDVLVLRRGQRKRQGRPYSLWISDDARRLPLLLIVPAKVGSVRFEMVSYRRPRD